MSTASPLFLNSEKTTYYDTGSVGATLGATSERKNCDFDVFSVIDTTFQ